MKIHQWEVCSNFLLDKRKLHSRIGTVSWERQQRIKSKVREVLRF